MIKVMSAIVVAMAAGAAISAPVVRVDQTNLVSDIPGMAAVTDPNLQNPWGIATSATSPFWVSDNRTGLSTLYNTAGVPQALVVTIPPAGGANPPSAPTGVVFNGSSDFSASRFIFATEDGTIASWAPANASNAIRRVDNSASGAIYKGLAMGTSGASARLFAANFHAGTIDVFDSNFTQLFLGSVFTDPNLPAGYAPFNVQNFGGSLFVTYALQDANGEDDVAGAGHGFINVFDTNGVLQRRLVSGGALDSPWGMALAPASFGAFAGDLMVGNFGDGAVNLFDPASGALVGILADISGNPLSIPGLWGLRDGNGGNGGSANLVYFTAGIPGNGAIEDHGLFGSLAPLAGTAPVPEPSTLTLLAAAILGFALLRGRRHDVAARQPQS